MTEIRPEQPGDEEGIRHIHQTAFEGEEWRLVDMLRERGKNIVSLVACDGNNIFGHVLFTEVSIEPPAPFRGVGLAPVAVLPEWQGQGYGALLCLEGLNACANLGYDFAVVLGHTEYYPRFGFKKASLFGIGNQYGVDEPFMAIAFKPGVLGAFKGIVKYQPEFSELNV